MERGYEVALHGGLVSVCQWKVDVFLDPLIADEKLTRAGMPDHRGQVRSIKAVDKNTEVRPFILEDVFQDLLVFAEYAEHDNGRAADSDITLVSVDPWTGLELLQWKETAIDVIFANAAFLERAKVPRDDGICNHLLEMAVQRLIGVVLRLGRTSHSISK
jgi:hypothetical protein